jgi:uncharacterized integral membrane protein
MFGKRVWNSCSESLHIHVAQLHTLADVGAQALYSAYVVPLLVLMLLLLLLLLLSAGCTTNLWVCQVPWPAEHMGAPVGVLSDILAGLSAG